MNDNDRSVIWVPKLGFVNALGPFQTVVDDLVTGLLIREDETPLSEDISLPIEGEINFIQNINFSITAHLYCRLSNVVFWEDEFNPDDQRVLPRIFLQFPPYVLSI